MILVTGATGKTGGAAAQSLLKRGASIRVLVRDAGKASALKEAGAELVIGNASDWDVVAKAMDGVDRALLILPNSDEQVAQEAQFVDLAKEAGVKHLVKMSSMEAVPGTTNPIPSIHVQSENYIRDSGLPWTFIKPNFFMQNLMGSAATIKEQNKFFMPMKDGKTAMADVRDLGEAMAVVLTEDGHEGQSYELTGPELLSFADVADRFSQALGRKIEYVDVPMDGYMEKIAPFLLNDWHVNAVKELFSEIAEGGLDYTTDTIQKLLGRDPISVKQFVEDHKAVFS